MNTTLTRPSLPARLRSTPAAPEVLPILAEAADEIERLCDVIGAMRREHATQVGPDRHLCPEHAAKRAENLGGPNA